MSVQDRRDDLALVLTPRSTASSSSRRNTLSGTLRRRPLPFSVIGARRRRRRVILSIALHVPVPRRV